MAKIITMGETMLRLSTPNNEKFIQAIYQFMFFIISNDDINSIICYCLILFCLYVTSCRHNDSCTDGFHTIPPFRFSHSENSIRRTSSCSYFAPQSISLIKMRNQASLFRILFREKAFYAAIIFVKIIRPAAVCSTLVTITVFVSPICLLPPSITIIVPSFR